ncbi:MAG: LpxD N-terminal domain-containing protein, partial [Burkholderiales bacterium]
MKHSLKDVAKASGAKLMGDGNPQIGGVAGIANATADDLVFAEDAKRLEQALKSSAGAVLTGEFAATSKNTK